jgi:organic hydroperoxide reductase OsmC/OhrA
MAKEHSFAARLTWSGAAKGPTRTYSGYSRDYVVEIEGKPPLEGSSAPAFRGDPARHNPEDLLVAALSGCHLLWYLNLCADAGIEVVGYVDEASGTVARKDGMVRFTEVTLRPRVTIAAGDPEQAKALHAQAHAECFIANSVNFPVRHEAVIEQRG